MSLKNEKSGLDLSTYVLAFGFASLPFVQAQTYNTNDDLSKIIKSNIFIENNNAETHLQQLDQDVIDKILSTKIAKYSQVDKKNILKDIYSDLAESPVQLPTEVEELIEQNYWDLF